MPDALTPLHPQDERGGYETLTWRLQTAAREVARCQARLDTIDATLRPCR